MNALYPLRVGPVHNPRIEKVLSLSLSLSCSRSGQARLQGKIMARWRWTRAFSTVSSFLLCRVPLSPAAFSSAQDRSGRLHGREENENQATTVESDYRKRGGDPFVPPKVFFVSIVVNARYYPDCYFDWAVSNLIVKSRRRFSPRKGVEIRILIHRQVEELLFALTRPDAGARRVSYF